MTKRDEGFLKCFHYTGNVKQQVLFTLYVDCKVKYQSEMFLFMFLAVLAYEVTIFSETLVGTMSWTKGSRFPVSDFGTLKNDLQKYQNIKKEVEWLVRLIVCFVFHNTLLSA